MRVKITYTVELEEEESEVSEIMSRAVLDLDFSYQELVRIQMDLDTNVGDLKSKIQQLDIIRRKIAKTDHRLSDCQYILEGLNETRQKIEEKQNEIQDG